MNYFEHFTCKEFFPYCSETEISNCFKYGYFDNILVLFMILDSFREYVNRPIRVTSTFRDFEHNKRVGGSSTSQHLVGCAIDFTCPSLPFETLVLHFKDFCKESALVRFFGQVIFYHKSNFIHVGLCTPSHSGLTFQHEQRDN